MVKTKKKTVKRQSKKCSKAQFNYIASHYHKTVLTTSFRIELNPQTVRFVGAGTDNHADIQDLIRTCADYETYQKLFLSYKVTALSLEFSPAPITPAVVPSTTTTGTFPVASQNMYAVPAFAYLAFSDAVDYQSIIESNKHCLLSFHNKTKMFIPLTGGIASWFQTTSPNVLTGQLAVNVPQLPTSGSIFWQVILNFYITYKITV